MMHVFPVFPAMLLGADDVLAFGGLRGSHAAEALRRRPRPRPDRGLAVLLAVQLVFGFFAIAGLSWADWGAAVRDEKDVRVGGWVGVACAPWWWRPWR